MLGYRGCTKYTLTRPIAAISEFHANMWYGAHTNETTGLGGVQEAMLDCALLIPSYIPSLVTFRYRMGGFVSRVDAGLQQSTDSLVSESLRRVHGVEDGGRYALWMVARS